MTKKQHTNYHKKLHAALLLLIQDWQDCSMDGAKRYPQRRSVLSLVEWSERQTKEPDETVVQKEVSQKLIRERRSRFIFNKKDGI